MTTTYVTLATQLNRAFDKSELAGGTGGPLGAPLKRGDEFTEADVTPGELARWLTLKPRVVASKDELQAAAATAADARETIEDLQAQLAAATAELEAARAAGADRDKDGLPEPAPNGSKAAWQAYAVDKARRDGGGDIDVDTLGFINSEDTTRDDLKKRFGSTR